MNRIWFCGGIFAKSDEIWETWWEEEKAHLQTTKCWGKLLEVLLNICFFVFEYGIVYQLHIASGSTKIYVYIISWSYVLAPIGMFIIIGYARDKHAAKEHIYYRMVQSIIILVLLVIVVLLKFINFQIVIMLHLFHLCYSYFGYYYG